MFFSPTEVKYLPITLHKALDYVHKMTNTFPYKLIYDAT